MSSFAALLQSFEIKQIDEMQARRASEVTGLKGISSLSLYTADLV